MGSVNILLNTQLWQCAGVEARAFLAMLAFGALNFLSTKAQLMPADEHERSYGSTISQPCTEENRCRESSRFVIFSVTGLLTVLPPGVHALHQAAAAKMAASAASDAVPAAKLEPAEGASVKILSPTPQQVFAGDKVPAEIHS